MTALRSIIQILFILLAANLSAETGFSFQIMTLDVQIEIPEIPQMTLKTHPLTAAKPHLRYLGKGKDYNVSILTPTADAGMTPLECATSRILTIGRQNGLKQKDYPVFASEDKTTYGMFYALKIAENATQLNAHLISAAHGTHCIEVHISKVTTDKKEVKAWYKGMRGARIKAVEK